MQLWLNSRVLCILNWRQAPSAAPPQAREGLWVTFGQCVYFSQVHSRSTRTNAITLGQTPFPPNPQPTNLLEQWSCASRQWRGFVALWWEGRRHGLQGAEVKRKKWGNAGINNDSRCALSRNIGVIKRLLGGAGQNVVLGQHATLQELLNPHPQHPTCFAPFSFWGGAEGNYTSSNTLIS